MTRKLLALLAVAVMLFAACGKEGEEATLAEGEATAAPSASAAVASGAKAAPGATTAPGGAAKTTAPAATGAAATRAPGAQPPPPAQGGANRPKDGTYVYNVNGSASDPFNPAAPPQKYSGEQTKVLSHQGDVYTEETTSSEQAGRTTIRTRWATDRVTMLSFKSETQGGEFSCTFNPPLLITKFPTKPETYPKQQLKGQGNACNGSLEITIVKREMVKDASGRAWSTWQAKVRLMFKTEQVTVTNNETRWVSPDLGETIKSVATADGKFGPTTFKGTANTLLKTHP
jgi:hypothetical protein